VLSRYRNGYALAKPTYGQLLLIEAYHRGAAETDRVEPAAGRFDTGVSGAAVRRASMALKNYRDGRFIFRVAAVRG
jgi:hypothetical protein